MSDQERWFDDLLSGGTETAPVELRDAVDRLVREGGIQAPRHRGRRLVAIASAAAAIVLLVVGLAVVVSEDRVEDEPDTTLVPADSAPVTTAAPTTTPLSTPTGDQPTVEARVDVGWALPTDLPEGIDLRYALDAGPMDRRLVFGSGDCRFECSGEIWVMPAQVERDSRATDLVPDGSVWELSGGIFRDLDGEVLVVEGQNYSNDELVAIARSIERRPETELGRPPLVWPGNSAGPAAPVVAETTIDGGADRWQLQAHSDGELIALGPLASDDTPGPFYGVSDDDPLMLGFRPGRFMSPRAPSGTSFVYGVARPNVVRLEFELPDGSTAVAETADGGDGFTTRFVMATLPDRDASLTEVLIPWETVTAYDARGAVVAVYDGQIRR